MKILISIFAVLSGLFGIYQLVIAEYITGVIWIVAGLVGLATFAARSGKVAILMMVLFNLLLLGVFVCHIVFLAIMSLSNDYESNGYPGLNNAVDNTFATDLTGVKRTTHIVGICVAVVFAIISVPLYLILAKTLRSHNKKLDRQHNSTYDRVIAEERQHGGKPLAAQPGYVGNANAGYAEPMQQQPGTLQQQFNQNQRV